MAHEDSADKAREEAKKSPAPAPKAPEKKVETEKEVHPKKK
jgi:hypothetical protein